jgi:hypothetical protein
MPEQTPALLTSERLREIAEREAAATEGPWFAVLYADTWLLQSGEEYTDPSLDGRDTVNDFCKLIKPGVSTKQGGLNMTFAAHARQDIPALLAHASAQAREIERLRDALEYRKRVDSDEDDRPRVCYGIDAT